MNHLLTALISLMLGFGAAMFITSTGLRPDLAPQGEKHFEKMREELDALKQSVTEWERRYAEVEEANKTLRQHADAAKVPVPVTPPPTPVTAGDEAPATAPAVVYTSDAFRPIPYMAARAYRPYRPYRDYQKGGDLSPGTKADCGKFPFSRICRGTELYCRQDPSTPECVGTRLHCEKNPSAELCQGTEAFCQKDPVHPGCMGTAAFCIRTRNPKSCVGMKQICEADTSLPGCLATPVFCQASGSAAPCEPDET